jgi:hypothetical protein
MRSIKQIRDNLKTFDNSDIEDYTSSDEEGEKSGCLRFIPNIFKKHKYNHIIEVCLFLH